MDDRRSTGPDEAPSASPLKVTDRRKFTADGELREDGRAEVGESSERDVPTENDRAHDASGFERRPVQEPEGVSLTMLISAMAQQALGFLGEIPTPGADPPAVNVEQARLQIDMLDLLRVKCRGNLTAQEETLLEQALYQLRMLYVARTRRVT